MSAYHKQETAMTDQSALIEALKAKGYETVESHEKPQHLVGYHGDERVQTAEVIVRRKFVGSASNDIGFKKDSKGNFEALISNHDKGIHNAKWLSELKQEYGLIKAKKIAKKNGWETLSQKTQNGKQVLQFVVRK